MGEEGGDAMRIGKRCFVGNLAWRTSWQDLKDKFRECGNVVYANVTKDDTGRASRAGRSKGWGIVEFETPEEAIAAVNTLNGSEIDGRKIMVREDREDRDVKAPGGGPAAGGRGEGRGGRGRGEGRGPRPDRADRPPRERGEGGGGRGEGGRGRGRGPPPPRPEGESSGLQVVVQGIPWKFTWKELKETFTGLGEIERADVVYGADGRSRGYGTVRFLTAEAAAEAVEKTHGTELEGRTLTVFLDKYA